MKIIATTLSTGESTRTAILFTDDKFEYEVTLPGDYSNPIVHPTLCAGFLSTLTEYELIESMTDQELKQDRIEQYFRDEDDRLIADQMVLEHHSTNHKAA